MPPMSCKFPGNILSTLDDVNDVMVANNKSGIMIPMTTVYLPPSIANFIP